MKLENLIAPYFLPSAILRSKTQGESQKPFSVSEACKLGLASASVLFFVHAAAYSYYSLIGDYSEREMLNIALIPFMTNAASGLFEYARRAYRKFKG